MARRKKSFRSWIRSECRLLAVMSASRFWQISFHLSRPCVCPAKSLSFYPRFSPAAARLPPWMSVFYNYLSFPCKTQL